MPGGCPFVIGDTTRTKICDKFEANRNFVISRTKNGFSSMGLDQRYEQLNKDAKGNGRMIGQ